MSADFERRCARAVRDLHVFFEAWLGGRPGVEFSTFRTRVDTEMVHIGPDGTKRRGIEVLRWLEASRGALADKNFRIWIEQLEPRALSPDYCLVTYEEWQEIAGNVSRRLSSALFRHDPARPGGVVWLHVQETWQNSGV